jgi:hypothetical protein
MRRSSTATLRSAQLCIGVPTAPLRAVTCPSTRARIGTGVQSYPKPSAGGPICALACSQDLTAQVASLGFRDKPPYRSARLEPRPARSAASWQREPKACHSSPMGNVQKREDHSSRFCPQGDANPHPKRRRRRCRHGEVLQQRRLQVIANRHKNGAKKATRTARSITR